MNEKPTEIGYYKFVVKRMGLLIGCLLNYRIVDYMEDERILRALSQFTEEYEQILEQLYMDELSGIKSW